MNSKRCPNCNKWVQPRKVSGSSSLMSSDTASSLKTAANFSCKAATALDFIPGGRIVGALLSGLTQAGIDALSEVQTNGTYYVFKCHKCGYKWTE